MAGKATFYKPEMVEQRIIGIIQPFQFRFT